MSLIYQHRSTGMFTIVNYGIKNPSGQSVPIEINKTGDTIFTADITLGFLFTAMYFNGNKVDIADTVAENILHFVFTTYLVIPNTDAPTAPALRIKTDQIDFTADSEVPLSKGSTINFSKQLNLTPANLDVRQKITNESAFVINIAAYNPAFDEAHKNDALYADYRVTKDIIHDNMNLIEEIELPVIHHTFNEPSEA